MNTSEYIPTNKDYINVDTVKKSESKTAVIIDQGDWKEFGEGDEKVRKPYITVEMDGHMYEWTLSKTANQQLGEELTYDTASWVGATIKFFVVQSGIPYVSATVLSVGGSS